MCVCVSGSQMVVAMKAISLAFDLDRGAVGRLPSPAEYLGYVLFVGTVVFGPWISFSTYSNAVEGTKLVSSSCFQLHWGCSCSRIVNVVVMRRFVPQSWSWLRSSSFSLLKSQMCLLVSTCIAPYLFPLLIPIHGNTVTQK